MRKLLSILSIATLTSSITPQVIACEPNSTSNIDYSWILLNDQPQNEEELIAIGKIIFEQRLKYEKIWSEEFLKFYYENNPTDEEKNIFARNSINFRNRSIYVHATILIGYKATQLGITEIIEFDIEYNGNVHNWRIRPRTIESVEKFYNESINSEAFNPDWIVFFDYLLEWIKSPIV